MHRQCARGMLATVLVASLAIAAGGEQPEIIGFRDDGRLTFATAGPNSSFTLEFTSDLATGDWANWSTLTGQPITGAVMNVPAPLFFRIRESPAGIVMDAPLRNYLCAHGFDRNGDFRISPDEGAAIEALFIDHAGFQDPDFAAFTNLTSLSIVSNLQLTNFSISGRTNLAHVSVSGCTNLRNLKCTENGLTSINASGCADLDRMECSDNLLTSVNVAGCGSLKYIDFRVNRIKYLNLAGATNLIHADLRWNLLEWIAVPNTNDYSWLLYDGSPEIVGPDKAGGGPGGE